MVSDGKGGACEMMVWLVQKGRVPVCCHSQLFLYNHVKCVSCCGKLGKGRVEESGEGKEEEQKSSSKSVFE